MPLSFPSLNFIIEAFNKTVLLWLSRRMETRRMMDIRRTGAVEAIAGHAQPAQLANAMGNSLSESNKLFNTYVPTQLSDVLDVSKARLAGRKNSARRTNNVRKSELG